MTDFQTQATAAAIKANLYGLFQYLGRSPRAELAVTPELVRWHTPVPHPWFNGVLATRRPGENAAGLVQGALAYFKERQVESFSWWPDSGLDPRRWSATLEAQGFAYSHDTPGMAVDLRAIRAHPLHLAGLEIVTVEDLDSLRTWNRTFIRGYGLPDALEAPFYELIAGLGPDLPCRYYLGYLKNRPLATSTLFLGAGVAGVYNVATLPQGRGQGAGTALTLAALEDALRMGCHIGVLQSSEMGYQVYSRLGFQELCRMEHWVYS